MNKTEAAYAVILDARKAAGEIVYWKFESHKIKLAEACWYTPDFMVFLSDGMIEFHETKGGVIEDDALVKFKVVREQNSWARFRMLRLLPKKKGGGFEEIYPEKE